MKIENAILKIKKHDGTIKTIGQGTIVLERETLRSVSIKCGDFIDTFKLPIRASTFLELFEEGVKTGNDIIVREYGNFDSIIKIREGHIMIDMCSMMRTFFIELSKEVIQ